MKENHELARALTGIDGGLLLEAENAGRNRKTLTLRRLAAAVAIAASLAATVYAAAAGISWTVEKEKNSGEGLALSYYKDYDGELEFEKLEYQVPLEVVELPERNMAELKALLNRHWNLTQLEDYVNSHDPAPDREFVYDSWDADFFMENFMATYGAGRNQVTSFETLAEVENLLGIVLDVPLELRNAIRQEPEEGYSQPVTVRIYTGVTERQAAQTKGKLEPTRIVISFQVGQYAANGDITGSITIPLTEEAAREGLQGLHYSYEKEGAIWQEEQTVGGWDVTVFGNAPETGYDGWCKVIYTDGGIGYCISARRDADIPFYTPDWPSYGSAKEIVLSLLEPQG